MKYKYNLNVTGLPEKVELSINLHELITDFLYDFDINYQILKYTLEENQKIIRTIFLYREYIEALSNYQICSKFHYDINLKDNQKFKHLIKTVTHSPVDIIYIICSQVAMYYNIPIEQLHAKSNKREIVEPRQVAMYFAKKLTKCSLAYIGALVGLKHHATVLHACKVISNLKDTDKTFKSELELLEENISNQLSPKDA